VADNVHPGAGRGARLLEEPGDLTVGKDRQARARGHGGRDLGGVVVVEVAVADQQRFRAGGCVRLADEAGVDDGHEAADGGQAVAQVREHRPDVVLMDVRMPVLDGIEATRVITTDPATAGARILILTTFDLDDYVYRALHAGASGFLLKDTVPEELLVAIRTLAAGDVLLAPSVTRRLIRGFAARPEPEERP
jgi:DNA-binding NarL/FixJ family response regulator